LFSLWGVWFAVVFVPVLNLLWIPLNVAKAIWLFTNSVSTWISSFMNWKRKVLNLKFGLYLAISTMIWSIIWSYLSKYIDVKVIKVIFVVMLTFSLFMMFYKSKLKEKKWKEYIKPNIFVMIWSFIIWCFSWLLGIWWGLFLVPLLVLSGYDAKFVSRNISLVIFLSCIVWFLTYLTFVKVDYILLLISSVGALIGWYLGNWVMHYKLDQNKVRYILIILILIVILKLLKWLI